MENELFCYIVNSEIHDRSDDFELFYQGNRAVLLFCEPDMEPGCQTFNA